MDIKIVFENNELVIVDKDANILSVTSRDPKDKREILDKDLEKKLNVQLFPVHRLDYEVSGLIIFCKNKEYQKIFSDLFENKKIVKTYQALTVNKAGFKFDTIETWTDKILKGKKRAYESPMGNEAITEVLSCKTEKNCLNWVLRPLTGRSHQLRFQLFKRGFPILGDELYSSKDKYEKGIALRAIKIELDEPFLESHKIKIPLKFEVAGLLG